MPHKHESQLPFPSRPNRGGSKVRKPKKREEADNKKTVCSGILQILKQMKYQCATALP